MNFKFQIFIVLIAIQLVACQFPKFDTVLSNLSFGSCNDEAHVNPLWQVIAASNPEMFLFLGDNIYGDIRNINLRTVLFARNEAFLPANKTILAQKYKALVQNTSFGQYMMKVPRIGIWDDHDFGVNDGDKTYPYRKESQELFLDFMMEEKDSPRRKQEGIYTSYDFGVKPRLVRFILLDGRYHKDKYGTENGDFLGQEQWHWLNKTLYNSPAAFNIIASGIQVLPVRGNFAEHWSRFPNQRQKLLTMIQKSNARGVVLLSGDVHFAEILKAKCDSGQQFLEVTTSGMTHSWLNFRKWKYFFAFLFRWGNFILPMEYRENQQDYFGGLNFGNMVFDWKHEVPSVKLFVHDKYGSPVLQSKVYSNQSELNHELGHECHAMRSTAFTNLRVTIFVAFTVLFIIAHIAVPIVILRRLCRVMYTMLQQKPKVN